jgi:hypothetical protein
MDAGRCAMGSYATGSAAPAAPVRFRRHSGRLSSLIVPFAIEATPARRRDRSSDQAGPEVRLPRPERSLRARPLRDSASDRSGR